MALVGKLNYKTAPQAGRVLVVCGGLSTTEYADAAIAWLRNGAKRRPSISISTNYNFESIGIISDYTYLTDPRKFLENIDSVNSNLILPASLLSGKGEDSIVQEKIIDTIDRIESLGKRVFRLGSFRHPKLKKFNEQIRLSPNGEYKYRNFGPAGFGALLSALLMKPAEVLVIGLDGYSGKAVKQMFTGDVVPFKKKDECKNIKLYLNQVFKLYRQKKVLLSTYAGVGLYGMPKRKCGFNVLGK